MSKPTKPQVHYLGEPLTLKRIRAAYEKTGLKPIRRATWRIGGSPDSTDWCACPLAAVACAEGAVPFGASADDLQALGLPHGFITGFDQERRWETSYGPDRGESEEDSFIFDWVPSDCEPAYLLGRQVGQALFGGEDRPEDE